MTSVTPVRNWSVRPALGGSLLTKLSTLGWIYAYKCLDLDCDSTSTKYLYTSIYEEYCSGGIRGPKYFQYGGKTLGIFTYWYIVILLKCNNV